MNTTPRLSRKDRKARAQNQAQTTMNNEEQQFAPSASGEPAQPGQMLDGSSSEGVSSGAVHAIEDDRVLLGTDRQPAYVQIGEQEVQLGTLVAGAHTFSGLTARQWNLLPVDARADRIDAWIEQQRDEAVADREAAPASQDDPDCVAGETTTAQIFQQNLKENGGQDFDVASAALAARVVGLSGTGRGLTSALQHIDELGYMKNPVVTSDPLSAAPAAQSPEEELPLADPNTVPAIPSDFGPHAMSAIGTVVSYIPAMHPRKPIAAAEMLRQQVSLYRAITTLINKVEGEEFTRGWNWLLEQFSLYRQGVFAEKYVFRGFESMTLSETDRRAFQRLLNLLLCSCDPRSRSVVMRQVDLTRTLELGVTESGRQRVMQFYGL